MNYLNYKVLENIFLASLFIFSVNSFSQEVDVDLLKSRVELQAQKLEKLENELIDSTKKSQGLYHSGNILTQIQETLKNSSLSISEIEKILNEKSINDIKNTEIYKLKKGVLTFLSFNKKHQDLIDKVALTRWRYLIDLTYLRAFYGYTNFFKEFKSSKAKEIFELLSEKYREYNESLKHINTPYDAIRLEAERDVVKQAKNLFNLILKKKRPFKLFNFFYKLSGLAPNSGYLLVS